MPEFLVKLVERQMAERTGTAFITADSAEGARKTLEAHLPDDEDIQWGEWMDPNDGHLDGITVAEVYPVGKTIDALEREEG